VWAYVGEPANVYKKLTRLRENLTVLDSPRDGAAFVRIGVSRSRQQHC